MPVADRGGALAEEAQRAALLAAQLEGPRHADGHHHHVGQHRDHAEDAAPRVAEVDVAVAAAADAAGAAQVVAEDRGRRGALDDVRAKVADQRADRVIGAEREGRADRGGLLAAAVIERPRYLALLVEAQSALLDRARTGHQRKERDAIVTLQKRCAVVLGASRRSGVVLHSGVGTAGVNGAQSALTSSSRGSIQHAES
ncbi:MAG: hypothetical protein ABSF58_01960 [Solirubrobacteraceae bacterium]